MSCLGYMNPFSPPTLCLLALMFPCSLLAEAPSIAQQPIDQTIFYGDPVTFTVGASGVAPLSYQWYRNGNPIAAATTSVYNIPSVSSNEAAAGFWVIVTNLTGTVTSRTAALNV